MTKGNVQAAKSVLGSQFVNILFILRGCLILDKGTRRLEELKLEGLAFSQAEVVNELSIKLTCSKRVLYKDFESREIGQPVLQSVVKPDGVLLKVMNRYEQIYRQPSLRLITMSNELAQIATLNIMLKANSLLCETAVLPPVFGLIKFIEWLYLSQVFLAKSNLQVFVVLFCGVLRANSICCLFLQGVGVKGSRC
jgi:hypothetical protein